MYFFQTTPTSPKVGDVTFIDGTMNIWDGTAWQPVAPTTTPSYIEDANGNKIEADRTFTWRETCSWFVSEMNGGIYTYDPPLECAWGTYTIDDGQSQTQTQMWISKTPYDNNKYFGIGFNLEYVEYFNKVGDTYVVITGDVITEHTDDNSITMIGLESCSITRTGEWSDRTATLATEEWVGGRDFIQDSAGNKIEADRTAYYMVDGTPYWTVTYNGENYQLSGSRESSSYYPENPQVGDLAFALEYSNSNWLLTVYELYDDGTEGYWD